MPIGNNLAVRRLDPKYYKNDVIELWQNHGFSSERTYIWYYLENPNPIYLFGLIDLNESDRLVGTASIAHRKYYRRGEKLSGGLIGNILIDEGYRYQQRRSESLGSPAQILLQHCLVVGREEFDFIYVYPVGAAHKALIRAGLNQHYNFTRYGQLLDVRKILEPKIPAPAAKLLSTVPNYLLKAYRTYSLGKLPARETSIVSCFDHRFSDLNERSIKSNDHLLSDHDTNYLEWRYLDINDSKYAIYALHSLDNNSIDGFIVYRDDPESSCAYVMDYLTDSNKISEHQLFLQFANDMSQCNRQSISIEYCGATSFLKVLKKLKFYPRETRKLHLTPCNKLGGKVTGGGDGHFLAGQENSRN